MKLLTKFYGLLDGKKSYITAVLLVVLSGMLSQGYLDQKSYEVIVTLLGAFGLLSVKSAINKLNK